MIKYSAPRDASVGGASEYELCVEYIENLD